VTVEGSEKKRERGDELKEGKRRWSFRVKRG
jgi:hypothetical protein